MSYTVLARRYRSGTFDEIIGQEHVAQTLKKAIETGRIAHAFLFCGTRGTGKTSTARVLAKALNCQNASGPTTQPCGKCASCMAIARGEDMDVVEIDAASNTGVDNVRDIIENSQYVPAHSRFKIYIIDEVHMLSKSAFNALLKTLEEPPVHVKFILATTEPEKVLPTILSRCQRYDFHNIPTRQIAEHLKEICAKEKIEADEGALLLVAKAGAGSMRDALSLLDRLLSVGETRLSAEMIEQLLGLPKSQRIYDLAQGIAQSDVKGVLARADALLQSGLSADALLASLVEHLRNLLILGACGAESKLVDAPGLPLKDLAEQAGRFDGVVLSQDIVLLEELRRQLRLLQGGRALIDATLVRLTLADQFNSISDLLRGAAPSDQKKKPELNAAAGEAEAAGGKSVQSEDTPDELPAVGKVWEGEQRSLSAMFAARRASANAPVSPSSSAQQVDPEDHDAVWRALLGCMAEQGAALHGVLTQGCLARVEEDQAVIQIAAQHETFIQRLQANGKKDLLRDHLSRLLQRPVGVRFEMKAAGPPAAGQVKETRVNTPAMPEAQVTVQDSQGVGIVLTAEVRAEVEADPLIHAIIHELGGELRSLAR